jgi:glyoxylase-like metal-dependent hydrolase (beta-lactamase superfamily II)
VGDLAALGIALVRADNSGPLTLTGTNTWIVGRDPAWVVDPGPALQPHLGAVAAEVARRGGAGGVAVTHDHADHAEGVDALRERVGAVPVTVGGRDGATFGPLEVLALPGHADDHVVFLAGGAAFTGDAVLGEGSVFVSGRMAGYLDGLRRLRDRDPIVLCPGHGPPVWDVRAKLDGYLEHRLAREAALRAAWERGLRTEGELLDAVWADAPPALRPAAAVTLRAHLEKLRAEGRV